MKKRNVFQVPAALEGVSLLKDGGVSLRFHTQELTKEDKILLMDFANSFGYLMFALNEFDDADVPTDNVKNQDGKSASQRLRAVIYVSWRDAGGKGDFETYYRRRMEQHINVEKQGLK